MRNIIKIKFVGTDDKEEHKNSMKRVRLFYLILFFSFLPLIWRGGGITTAQQNVGIGTTAPHPSARLDIFSNHQGLLIPRVGLLNITDTTVVQHPAMSLMVYNNNPGMTGGGLGIYYWNGGQWIQAFGVAGGIGATGTTGIIGASGLTGATGSIGATGAGNTGA